ncbi:MAG: hypothetical protein AAF490_08055 [Chloroflexota bacterium]
MRIEKKQDEEIARRQGMTGKTMIQVIWFVFTGAISYFLVTFLLNSEEVNFSYALIYNTTGLPRTVPEGAVLALLVLIFIIIFQVFLWLGFALASPEGRRKTGQPTMYSRNKDPFDQGH